MARTFTLLRVFSHRVIRFGRPTAPTSIAPEMIDLRGPAERGPLHLDVAEPLKLRVLLDEFLILHDDELDVGQAVLLAELDLTDFGTGGKGRQ
jgi:hypothetical protein